MALIYTGSMGSVQWCAQHTANGYHVPRIELRPIAVPGLVGDLDMWNAYKAPETHLFTETPTIRGSTVISTETQILQYVGTIQTLTVSNANSATDTYNAKILAAMVKSVPGINSQDQTYDTLTFVEWTLKLYRITS